MPNEFALPAKNTIVFLSKAWRGWGLCGFIQLDQREHLCKNLRFGYMRQLKSRKINGLDST